MIQLYLDGCLSKGEKRTFEGHIEGCVSCKTELEAFSVLFSGLENMPLDEPPTDFNAEVLSRIPFRAMEPVSAKRSLLGITSGVVLAVALTVLSSLGFYSIVADSGRISYTLSNGFLKAVGVMEWLSLNSLQGVVNLVKMANDLPILSSLALLGRIFLSVASTIITDPFFALMLSGMTMIGIISSVMMARIVRPNWSRVSVNGAGTNRFLHFQ